MGLTSVRGDIVMVRHIAIPPIYVCDWKSNKVVTLSFHIEVRLIRLNRILNFIFDQISRKRKYKFLRRVSRILTLLCCTRLN